MTAQQNYRVDSFVSGLAIKAPVRVATTANITLIGEQTINTVACVVGDRVLVKDQTNPIENGIYTVEETAWQRAGDFDGNRDVVKGTLIPVETPAGEFELWQVTSATPTIGSSSITIELYLVKDTGVAATLQAVTDAGATTTNDVYLNQIIMTEDTSEHNENLGGTGRIWIKNTTPCQLWYTDDQNGQFQLGTGGTGGINNVVEDSTPELGGNLGCLDYEVQRPEIKDYAVSSSSPSIAAGAITFDCVNGNTFQVTLNANITSITLSNPPASGNYGEILIKFVQDATGSRTVTGWPASVKWPGGTAPTITGTATTGTDLILLSTWDGGTTWFGSVSQDYS